VFVFSPQAPSQDPSPQNPMHAQSVKQVNGFSPHWG
jgi:hypothetical protein